MTKAPGFHLLFLTPVATGADFLATFWLPILGLALISAFLATAFERGIGKYYLMRRLIEVVHEINRYLSVLAKG